MSYNRKWYCFSLVFNKYYIVTELYVAYIQIIYYDGPHGVGLDCPYVQRDH